MKHSYIVFWEDLNGNGESDPGWYCQVSNLLPWGPFDSQAEALESMLMEWPRFENMSGSACDSACGTAGCSSCESGCCSNV